MPILFDQNGDLIESSLTDEEREELREQMEDNIDPDLQGVACCRVCGCTDEEACPGGCHWIEPDLCSKCEEEEYGA